MCNRTRLHCKGKAVRFSRKNWSLQDCTSTFSLTLLYLTFHKTFHWKLQKGRCLKRNRFLYFFCSCRGSLLPVDLGPRIFLIREKSVRQENTLPYEFDFHALLNVHGSNYSGFSLIFFLKKTFHNVFFFLIMKGRITPYIYIELVLGKCYK